MAKTHRTEVPVSRLQKGIRIKLPLAWTDHPFLFNQINIVNDEQIRLIQALGVNKVILLEGEPAPEPEHPQQIRSVEQRHLPEPERVARRNLRQSHSQFIKAVNGIRFVLSCISTDPQMAGREATVLVDTMLEQLLGGEQLRLAYATTGEDASSPTQHGVSVAALSLVMGVTLGLGRSELQTVACGALFHDIGKLKVPEATRCKRGALSKQEKGLLAMHPNFGYDLLKPTGLLSPEVLDIILHHHEFVDGSGYPDGLTAEELPLTTLLVALANDYDTQLLREELASPQVALGYIFKHRAGKYPDMLIQALVKVLGVYPPGTLVRLSDGSVGKVVLTSDAVKQPHVWSCQEDGSDPRYRFLIQENIEVMEVLRPEMLTEAAQQTLQLSAGISFYFCHQ